MRSAKHGERTLVEITNISSHGLWLYMNGQEYLLPFEKYPWFRNATIAQIQNVESPRPGFLHWPELDVDLHTEILENPDKFPLQARTD